jgi:hypothetical protein
LLHALLAELSRKLIKIGAAAALPTPRSGLASRSRGAPP